MMDGSYVLGMPTSPSSDRDIMFSMDSVTQAALHLQELDPAPPAAATRQEFHSEPFFAVMLPAKGGASERRVVGELVQIGGGWDAWIRHGNNLARVYRGADQEHAVGYLRKYQQQRIKDGGRDLSAAEDADGA